MSNVTSNNEEKGGYPENMEASNAPACVVIFRCQMMCMMAAIHTISSKEAKKAAFDTPRKVLNVLLY